MTEFFLPFLMLVSGLCTVLLFTCILAVFRRIENNEKWFNNKLATKKILKYYKNNHNLDFDFCYLINNLFQDSDLVSFQNKLLAIKSFLRRTLPSNPDFVYEFCKGMIDANYIIKGINYCNRGVYAKEEKCIITPDMEFGKKYLYIFNEFYDLLSELDFTNYSSDRKVEILNQNKMTLAQSIRMSQS